MPKAFKAEVKFYDPDHEYEDEFDSWTEAEEWFQVQRRFGMCGMWLNNERVKLHNGVLVNDEPFDVSPVCQAIEGLARANMDFDKLFRPQPTRGAAPANVATLLAKGVDL